jgi:hypothetical protein
VIKALKAVRLSVFTEPQSAAPPNCSSSKSDPPGPGEDPEEAAVTCPREFTVREAFVNAPEGFGLRGLIATVPVAVIVLGEQTKPPPERAETAVTVPDPPAGLLEMVVICP